MRISGNAHAIQCIVDPDGTGNKITTKKALKRSQEMGQSRSFVETYLTRTCDKFVIVYAHTFRIRIAMAVELNYITNLLIQLVKPLLLYK